MPEQTDRMWLIALEPEKNYIKTMLIQHWWHHKIVHSPKQC